MAVNYVRFLRGTPTAFKNVTNPDPDTLYFISEKDASTGDLYLGSKLIAGKDLVISMSLGDLKNVITNKVGDSGSLLVFDETQGKWVQKSPSELASSLYYAMKGATQDNDGAAGYVPAPKAGQQNLYLRGNAEWADPTAEVNKRVDILVGADAGLSIRQIAVATLEKALIPEKAKESLNTLGEIADWIQSHPDSASDLNSRLIKVENVVFDTLDDQKNTIKGLQSVVGDMSTEFKTIQTGFTNLQSDVRIVEGDIKTIYDRLRWHEMTEDGGTES